MKNLFSFFFFLISFLALSQVQHCGYDFTSYIVVEPKENGKNEIVEGLKITIVDAEGNEIINVNNELSWTNNNKPLLFESNTIISKPNDRERWFFPYAKASYFLSVANTFAAEKYYVKIEDPANVYATQIIALQSYNLYILCSTENEKQSRQFGPRTNRPIEVILEKK
jgi:hypothetical protein